jgi:hypothetical protein
MHADIITLFLYVITTTVEALVPVRNQCIEALCSEILVKSCNQVIITVITYHSQTAALVNAV